MFKYLGRYLGLTASIDLPKGFTSINYEYNNVLNTLFVFYDANTLYRIIIYNLGIGYDLHKMLVVVVFLGNNGIVRLRPHR